MNNQTVTVDVREDIRRGLEPFSKIMQAAAALRTDESLLLIAPFEPVPLFRVMEKQGFIHHGCKNESGDWKIMFTRQKDQPPLATAPTVATSGQTPGVEVDARGLEPPQPMVKILEAVAAMPEGAELRARTDRRPMHLYPQLNERGFAAVSEEQSDGSFITHIRRH